MNQLLMEAKKEFRCIVVGDKKVGKTALTVRYLTKRFITEYPTGQDTAYTHNTLVDGRPVTIQLLDSSGKNSAVLAWADAVVVVYSVTNAKSFKQAKAILESLQLLNLRDCQISLVGNKTDLVQSRSVTTTEGQEAAKTFKCTFFEISVSKHIDAVQDVFESLVKAAIQKREQEKKPRTPQVVRKIFRTLSGGGLSARERSGTV